jgi:intermediate peptidase
MPGLHSPADFQRLGDEAAAVVARLSQMAISGNLEGMEFLEAFDEISDSLCLVLDTAELCRSVHPDPVMPSVIESKRQYVYINTYD